MRQFRSMVYPYVVWIAIMIVVPMLMILLYAFTKEGNDVTTFRFTLENFGRFFSDAVFLDVLKRSLIIAIFTTIICVLLGYPIAYAIATGPEKSKMFWILMITLPTWINMLVRTYAWVGILQDDGLLNSFLGLFGIGPFKMMYTTFAVVLGMVYNFLPFMVLPIYNVLSKIDDNIINAAMDLGANSFQRFIRIWFPLSIPGIISGITMVFVPSLTTFVISDLLGGSKILLIGNVIEQEFTRGSNWHLGSGLSLVLMVFILISMAMIAKYDKNGEGTAF